MKKRLKVYYANIPNAGDHLSKAIIEKVFALPVSRHTFLTGELSAVGSGLANYLYGQGVLRDALKAIFGVLFPSVTIWGSGFIDNGPVRGKLCKKNTRFAAVRGRLSKEKLESSLGGPINCALGDPGILADQLLEVLPEKVYEVGLVAHYREQNEPVFQRMKEHYGNACLIDVRKSPEEVIHQIASCQVILSSSLHGLVIADSLGIPNRHIFVSDKPLGDGFKFDDYYSAYGLAHVCTDLTKDAFPDLQEVCEQYPVTREMVKRMRQDMKESFPWKP